MNDKRIVFNWGCRVDRGRTPVAVRQWLIPLGLILMLTTGQAMAHRSGAALAHQAAVEDLAVCYARGTDLLGRAVNAVVTGPDPEDPVNIGNPEFDAALALYRSCFSKDFAFSLEIDGDFVLTVPEPATRTDRTDGALQWANFVNNAFRGPGYKTTQHHMGSISSKIRGRHARMVSYLIAYHVFGPASDGTEGSVRVVGGTYTDKVVRERGRWRIKHRTLNITSDLVTPAP